MKKHRDRSNNAVSLVPIPLACLNCRQRHLKCDGVQPECSRCKEGDQDCHYIQSRRGCVPSRKRRASSTTAGRIPQNIFDGKSFLDADESLDMSFLADDIAMPSVFDQSISAENNAVLSGQLTGEAPEREDRLSQNSLPTSMAASTSLPQISELAISQTQPRTCPPFLTSANLREFYYLYFHNAHPILVPQTYYSSLPASSSPPCTGAIMDYIGALYSLESSTQHLLCALEDCLFPQASQTSGYTVQALLLLAVVQHSQDKTENACKTLDKAVDLALQLGMNLESYAQIHGKESLVLQESWRRTWWELYVIDGMLATVHQRKSFRMHAAYTDMSLPCEESEYQSGCIGPSQTLERMDEYVFAEDEQGLSSYAYRIIAVKNLANLLKLNQRFCPYSADIIRDVDASITSWILHLPHAKQSLIDKTGSVDEMIFQAHMIINGALIFLHRPRSNLIFTDVSATTACTQMHRVAVPASQYMVHTAKACNAADRISSLITLPGSVVKHTPLFSCIITLGAVVHLSAFVTSQGTGQRAAIKDKLALSIGALKSVCETWAIADSVLKMIKAAAKEVHLFSTEKLSSIDRVG